MDAQGAVGRDAYYLADWQSRTHHLTMSVDGSNRLVDGFDVEGMANQLESVGARYYQITIGQNSGYLSRRTRLTTGSWGFRQANARAAIWWRTLRQRWPGGASG